MRVDHIIPEGYLSQVAIATRLRTSRQAVNILIRLGFLHADKIGTRVLVHQDEFARFLRERGSRQKINAATSQAVQS
jgi:transcriptional regulator